MTGRASERQTALGSVRWPAAARGPAAARARRAAFSLQEVMVAIGILGIGLILVAAIFPVSLAQHRDSVNAAAAVTLSERAKALMDLRVTTASVWLPVTSGATPPGRDSPYILLPFANIYTAGTTAALPAGESAGEWDTAGVAPAYANSISGVWSPNPPPSGTWFYPNNRLFFTGSDTLSDPRKPVGPGNGDDDIAAESAASRLVWYAFYREDASGGTLRRAVAVGRQARGEFFAQQNLNVASPYANPAPIAGLYRRLPVPWRVTVQHATTDPPRRLNNAFTGGLPLAALAPPGSLVMVSGAVYNDGAAPLPVVSGGRVLSVTDAAGSVIEVAEDVSDLPFVDNAGGPTFDLWVFPPGGGPGGTTKRGPVVEWMFF